jgi:N-methylhydantoinase A/oxoprolinase/acetone carboxylase beta subunit
VISRSISVAVDIGGTFTDVVAVNADSGRTAMVKVPSTPARLADGVMEGTRRALAQLGAEPGSVARFSHGTTVATNAVLERRGAVTGVLATDGFEDVLEIGRTKRSPLYDLFIGCQTPVFLAPRRRRRGVRERLGSLGEIVTPLDEPQARDAIGALLAEGVEAIAVTLLHSYRNPTHELRIRELVRELEPSVAVSLSCEVDPVFREYERTVVTAFDAYLRPVVAGYIAELERALAAAGIEAPMQVMQSRGGLGSAALVVARPVSVLLSGPAAGAIGGAFAGARSGFDDLITIDVGGTSADVAVVEGGRPLVTTEGLIDGFPLRVPMVDVTTVGAGGGSIAWLDAGGLHVGPRSAGAEPGPVCYGRGGTEPTVTDASLVLGYLAADDFAGGTMRLDPDAAQQSLEALGAPLGLTSVQAAAGIHRIVNARMADQIRLVTIRRGHDPRRFALVLLGGAGPLHGGRIAAELEIPTMIVPSAPGVLSAIGLLVSSIEHDASETIAVRVDSVDADELAAAVSRLEARVTKLMEQEGVSPGAATTTRLADLRYAGQSSTLEVPFERASAAAVLFHEAHERIYGHATPGKPVELVNLRVVQSWPLPVPSIGAGDQGATPARARLAYFEELGGFVDTPVLRRAHLQDGIEGPAIVEGADSTLVIYPGHAAVLDEAGNVIATLA